MSLGRSISNRKVHSALSCNICFVFLAVLLFSTSVNAGAWVRNPGSNCWTGHGAVDLEIQQGKPCGTMSFEACQQKCDELADCQGISVDVASGSSKFECFRRGSINIPICDQNTRYDTWVKEVTPAPATTHNFKHTVSGFSAGAIMAMMHFVAYSKIILGVGVIAGAPYGCQILPDSRKTCSKPTTPQPWDSYLEQCRKYIEHRASQGVIDPMVNMVGKPAYVYSGLHDTVVAREVMGAVDTQLRNLTLNVSVLTRFDIPSEHAFIVDNVTCQAPNRAHTEPFCGPKPGPTPGHGGHNVGGCCGDCRYEWWRPPINNCGYDMAGEMLQHLWNGLSPRSHFKPENLFSIGQSRFVPANTTVSQLRMDPIAWLYVPSACLSTSIGSAFSCRIHVHYHCCGCSWRVLNMGTSMVAETGLNSWAEANDIVILYPQAADYWDDANDTGCWYWDSSYAGKPFDTQNGLQLMTVISMVNHIPNMIANFSLAKSFLV